MVILMESERHTVFFIDGLNTPSCITRGVNLIIFFLILC